MAQFEGQRNTFTHLHNAGGQGFYGTDQRNSQHVQAKTELLRALGPTNPEVERDRILDEKDHLLEGSCSWVFEQDAFQTWWAGEEQDQILWIHGDPGKGKTMIISAAIEEISRRLQQCPDAGILAYFFCQQQEPRLNTATAVLKGLLYSLASRYDSVAHRTQELVSDESDQSFWTLQHTLGKLLELCPRGPVYLLVDALDECTTSLEELLNLVIRLSARTNVRWLVTSRNEVHIRERLSLRGVHTSLELNSSHVSAAVSSFINARLQYLTQLKSYSSIQQMEVQRHLKTNAHDTFLWVALVCKELEKRRPGQVRKTLTLFPSGLERLYDRMLTQVDEQDIEDANLCRQLLRFVAVAIAPQKLCVLPILSDFPEDAQGNEQNTVELVERCGSFLTVRNDLVHFVHQSAADFFTTSNGMRIFAYGYQRQQKMMASLCIDLMEKTLRKNVCNLLSSGIQQKEISDRDIVSRLPESVQYACCHWLKHTEKGTFVETTAAGLECRNTIQRFLKKHVLHWFEALALQERLSEAILGLAYLEVAAQAHQKDSLLDFVVDARRFVSTNRYIIENAPLQVYASALVFSPEGSIIRRHFQNNTPSWLRRLPLVLRSWGSCLQIFEGHSNSVTSVVFSPDGKLVASGSDDNTVRLGDAAWGQGRGTLEGHSNSVRTVVFSPDGKLVASGSYDNTVRLWDAASGEARGTLEGHSNSVTSVVFSPDGKLVASGSDDNTVRLWDAASGEARGALEGHSNWVWSVVFSPDGKLVASGSLDNTVRLWDAASGEARGALEGHSNSVTSVVFSPDGKLVASGSDDNTVRLWDAASGEARGTLEGHSNSVTSVVFSPDGNMIHSGGQAWNLQDIKSPGILIREISPRRQPITKVQRCWADESRQWITVGGSKVLWLPPDVRPRTFAVRDDTIALGNSSGRVTFIHINVDALSDTRLI
ncbi:MAG: hypothetical protein Q9162_002336 [Coniocarpon cinnabarinum]